MAARSARTSRASGVAIIVFIVLLALLGLSRGIAAFYTDELWFAELGHANVFWTTVLSKWGTGLVFGALCFVVLYINLRIAARMKPRPLIASTDARDFQLEQALRQARDVARRYLGVIVFVASVLFAISSGRSMATHWSELALWLHQVPYGLKDPQFGKDVSFFLFTLPALRTITDWLTGTLVLTLLATAAVHLVTGGIRPWARLKGFDPHVKAHLSVIAGLIVALQAYRYHLAVYALDLSARGQVTGASYTDVHAQLPALRILIVIALLCGVALIANIRFRGWRLPAMAFGVWIGATVLIGGVYPALVQQFRVEPNEVAAETPYIKRNIAMTRTAFGLNDIEVKPFSASGSLTATAIAADSTTVDNVRLWDPNIVSQSFQQLQGMRLYYDFVDVDIDRYSVDGTTDEVLISPREMNVDQLATQARTWVNEHLVYTHGYGAVVSPVNRVSGQGLPDFVVKDIPPSGAGSLKITRPAIYYGELTTNYVVASTGLREFDYPVGDENAMTTYTGKGGVAVGGPVRRAAFALRLSAPQLLFSSYVKPTSKVMLRRDLRTRIGTLAPWLRLDGDPYPVIIDGRIVWVVDGYTTSARFPYAERTSSGINYIRNSVKVTVDAYDGTTTLYAFDTSDPVLATWRKVFPGLVEPASRMPAALRSHLRYPEDLFRAQAEMYKTYHMRDPLVFYNKEDQWALPNESGSGTGSAMNPFYVLMRLPGERTEEFMLMVPFTPRNKDNMIGWMAAKSDPVEYGRRVVYTFPKQKLVLGPEQVSARVNQDPAISQQLTLWNQRGSGVLLGNQLVIPIDDSIVYVQPLYLQSEKTAMSQLTRVIVASGDKVAMEADLKSALSAVFGSSAGSGAASEETASVPTSIDNAAAMSLYERAIAAQKAGDWAAYGRYIKQLGTVLERLSKAATGTAR